MLLFDGKWEEVMMGVVEEVFVKRILSLATGGFMIPEFNSTVNLRGQSPWL